MAKLDKRTITTLPGPEAGKAEVTHWDDEVKGLGLRVLASGARSWIVYYRVGKAQRKVSLGDVGLLTPAKAREKAREMLAKAKLGQDARAEIVKAKAEAAETFEKLAEAYIAKAIEPRRRHRYVIEVRRYLLVDAKPLHGLPVASIKRQRIAKLLDDLSERAPVAADRCRAALSSLFAWAMKQGLAEENPAVAVARVVEPKARERTLTGDELRAIWEATEGPGDFNAIVRLLMLTGQRREEVAAMTWDEVDEAKALWSIPGERTKNHRPHDVPLSGQALGIIQAVPHRAGRALLFGERKGGFSGWSKGKERLDQRIALGRAKAAQALAEHGSAGVEEPDAKALGRFALKPWRLHDLRRTVVTGMAEIGVQPHVVEAVVNHISGHKGGVAGVYNRATYANEKRQALDRWAEWLAATVEGKSSVVVPLKRA